MLFTYILYEIDLVWILLHTGLDNVEHEENWNGRPSEQCKKIYFKTWGRLQSKDTVQSIEHTVHTCYVSGWILDREESLAWRSSGERGQQWRASARWYDGYRPAHEPMGSPSGCCGKAWERWKCLSSPGTLGTAAPSDRAKSSHWYCREKQLRSYCTSWSSIGGPLWSLIGLRRGSLVRSTYRW